VYRLLFSQVLSKLDPERAHHLAFDVIRALPATGLGPAIRRWTLPRLDQSVETLGLRFETPFGVAAGFDKDGKGVLGLGLLGFGHVEVGTITAIPQPGNPKPRLFRLIADRAVVNRMGFNNGGADQARRRLERTARVSRRPVLGVNIGKSRVVDVADATADYVRSATLLAPVADYLVVNVSSPNSRSSNSSRRCSKPSVPPPIRRRCSSRSHPTSAMRRSTASQSWSWNSAWTASSRRTRPSRATD
jgi:dihydroorotate dehydrogenase